MDGAKRFLAGLGAGYLHLIAGALVQIILIPFLIRTVGADETGIYLLLMTISQFAAIGVGWLAAAGVRLIGEMQAKDAASYPVVHHAVFAGFVGYGLFILVGCVIAASLIGSVWLEDATGASQQQLRNGVVLLGVYVAINYAHQADLAAFVGLLEQGRANLYRLAGTCMFALGAVPVMLIEPRIDLLMLMQAFSAAVCFAWARYELVRRDFVEPRWWRLPKKATMHSLFVRTGVAYLLFGIAQLLLQLGDTLLIGSLLGPAAVAAFAVLVKVPELVGIALSRVSDTLSPYFIKLDASAGNGERLKALFISTSAIQHTLALCAGAFYVVAGPWILEIWVGQENRPPDLLPYVLAAAFIFFQVVNHHDIVLHFACARVARLLPVRFVEVAAKVGLTLALFEEWSFIAPLLAYFIVQVFGVTWWYRVFGVRLARATGTDWLQGVVKPTTVAAIVAAALLAVGALLGRSDFMLLLVAGVIVASAFLMTIRSIIRVRVFLNECNAT